MSYDFSTVDLSKIDMTEDEVLTQSLIKKPDLRGPELVRNLRANGKETNITSNKIYSYGSWISSHNSSITRYTVSTSTPDYTDSVNSTETSTVLQSIMMEDSNFERMFDIRQYNISYSWNDTETMNTIQYYLSTNPWEIIYNSDNDASIITILRSKSLNEKPTIINEYVETEIRSKIGYGNEFEKKKRDTVLKSLSERIEGFLSDNDNFSMNVDYESLMWYRELLSPEERRKYDSRRGYFDWEVSRKRDKQDEFRTSFYRRPTTGRFDKIEYDYDMEQVALRLAELL